MRFSVSYFLLFLPLGCFGAQGVIKHSGCRIIDENFSENLVVGQSNLWPRGVIPFTISDKFTSHEVKLIQDAIRHIENGSCVTWQEHKYEEEYVEIITGEEGCFSSLGYDSNRDRHIVHLQHTTDSSTCMVLGTIVHQMLHVMGFDHEHNRADRDDFIGVRWKHIEEGKSKKFIKYADEKSMEKTCDVDSGKVSFDNCVSKDHMLAFDLPYGYGSIMHLGQYAYGKDKMITIIPKKDIPDGAKMGQRERLAVQDYKRINAAYCGTSKCKDYGNICVYTFFFCWTSLAQNYCPKTCKICK